MEGMDGEEVGDGEEVVDEGGIGVGGIDMLSVFMIQREFEGRSKRVRVLVVVTIYITLFESFMIPYWDGGYWGNMVHYERYIIST
jgi:hypothetical protein